MLVLLYLISFLGDTYQLNRLNRINNDQRPWLCPRVMASSANRDFKTFSGRTT